MARSVIHIVEPDSDLRTIMEEHLSAGGYRVTSSLQLPERGVEPAQWNELDLLIMSLSADDDARAILTTTGESRTVIFLAEPRSAFADTPAIVELIRMGAADFLIKPVAGTALLAAVHRALRVRNLEGRVQRLESRITRLSGHSILIGESSAVTAIQDSIEKAAASGAPVLITGETGCGKELAARGIHQLTERSGEFVAINCSTLSEDLFESELFGYEPGAFTGARGRKTGLIEHADEGTLFFDEIGDLAPAVQARLLRFLDDRKFRRLGGLREIEVDVKIIAATHKPLTDEHASADHFRSDLYFRLSVLTIRIPPLRERGKDVLLLVEHFLERAAAEYGHDNPPRLSDSAADLLTTYRWPGNIRELRNLAERLVANYSDAETILPDEIYELEPRMMQTIASPSDQPVSAETYHLSRAKCLAEFDERHLGNLIEQNGNNISAVARLLGLDRKTLTTRLNALKSLRE